MMYKAIVSRIREIYGTNAFIGLHEPKFLGNEKKYLLDAIDSTYVSSVGEYVNRFEAMICKLSGASHAVAIVNGTAALHISMIIAGVEPGDEVITQALTFVATANAIRYCGADPVFVDVDRDTLGLSPVALENFLEQNAERDHSGACRNKRTKRRISACIPMHTFGHPCRIDAIVAVCDRYGIRVVEDAAESIGSSFKGKQTGTFGLCGIYSFNGNKTITCGGGGAVITNHDAIARRTKHLTTTAKQPHPYEFYHDEIGYNYRLPNLNAALACAQVEQLEAFIARKRWLAETYASFFDRIGILFVREPKDARSNCWLNAIILPSLEARNEFLRVTNDAGVMTRPIWRLMNSLPMFSKCLNDGLENSRWLEERVVNIPSSVVAEATEKPAAVSGERAAH
jgi:aminotransferase in exopolysaccharide biosynthesis